MGTVAPGIVRCDGCASNGDLRFLEQRCVREREVVGNQVTSIELVEGKKRQHLKDDDVGSGDGYRRTRALGQTLFPYTQIPAVGWLLVLVGPDDDGRAG